MDKKLEEWKDIKNYEGLYQISNYGNVKSLNRKVFHSRGFYVKLKEKILKPSIHTDGYLQVVLNNQGTKTMKIHRLVALHFIDNLNNLEDINHLDNNKQNNHYLNIEWSSTRENCCYRSKNIKNSSDYTGVSFDKSRNQWVAQIRFNNRHNFLGRFKTEKEAYQKRINFEKENNIINKYL